MRACSHPFPNERPEFQDIIQVGLGLEIGSPEQIQHVILLEGLGVECIPGELQYVILVVGSPDVWNMA